MSYKPYNLDNYFELNNVKHIEGFSVDSAINKLNNDIKPVLDDFRRGKDQAVLNKNDLEQLISDNENLQNNSKYNKFVPSSGKRRPTTADAILTDLQVLNQTNTQAYILGTIALASLVVLTAYL
jgi:hypothetical protein